MLFNSYAFLVAFLPLTLCGYALAQPRGLGKPFLLAASLFFYGAWSPLLLASVAGNAGIVAGLARWDGRRRGACLAGGIAANLLVLGWFRYLAPAMPSGLSFYSFAQIGLLIAVGGGLARPALLDQALLAGWFPQLTVGPVLPARGSLPGIAALGTRGLLPEDLAIGAGFLLIGLLKKTLLAEPLASMVNAGFGSPDTLTLLPAWRAALGWTLMLYFDFSGYSDMAVGLGRMFGVRLPDNFNAPFKARSVIDYWQRWHMSVTRFLMMTLFTPLGLAVVRWRREHGRGVGRDAQRTVTGFLAMHALPLGVTMALAGVWHGSGWTYLVFGLLHAAFLCVNHAWRLWGSGPVRGSVLLTFLSVVIAGVVFRAASLVDAGAVLAGMIGVHGFEAPLPRDLLDAAWLAGLLALVWTTPTTQQIMQGGVLTLPRAAVFGCALTIAMLSLGGTGEFVYARF